MTVTLVYIIQNQLPFLKKHLAHNLNTLSCHTSVDCLIIDDGSVDDLKLYLDVHFPDVRYVKNLFQEGFSSSFQKILSTIKSEFFMILDPTIRIDYCDLSSICNIMKQQSYFVTTLPVKQSETIQSSFFKLCFQQGRLVIKQSSCSSIESITSSLHVSEAMVFDTRRYLIVNNHSSIYFTPFFSLFDSIYNASLLGWKGQNVSSCSLHKLSKTDHFYSYEHEFEDMLRDEFSFIWLNIRSFKLLCRHFVALLYVVFGFKIRDFKALIVHFVLWPFIAPKRIFFRWKSLRDIDVLS